MFNRTKYTNWYNYIILNTKLSTDNRKDANILLGYSERHHIIPKCMNGNDGKENLVYLSAREHFVCHLLLTKMIEDVNLKRKMQYALGKFIQCNKNVNRIFTSREYEIIQKNISLARTGHKHSKETLEKISLGHKGQVSWNKGLTTRPISDTHKKLLSDLYVGRPFEDRFGNNADEIKLKILNSKTGKSLGMLGKEHPRKGTTGMWHMSAESRLNISEAQKGIKFTEEHLLNISLANKKNGENCQGTHRAILECPHYKKTGGIGGIGGIKRYHFDNCKLLRK